MKRTPRESIAADAEKLTAAIEDLERFLLESSDQIFEVTSGWNRSWASFLRVQRAFSRLNGKLKRYV